MKLKQTGASHKDADGNSRAPSRVLKPAHATTCCISENKPISPKEERLLEHERHSPGEVFGKMCWIRRVELHAERELVHSTRNLLPDLFGRFQPCLRTFGGK